MLALKGGDQVAFRERPTPPSTRPLDGGLDAKA